METIQDFEDLLAVFHQVSVGVLPFEDAWARRIVRSYGGSTACRIDRDSLIAIKSQIPPVKHQEDARILREVKRLREGEARST